MRNLVARCFFLYGCGASIGALVWYGAALAGWELLPQNALTAITFIILFGIATSLTFQGQSATERPWEPVLQVTANRVRLAKLALGLVLGNFVMSWFLVKRQDPDFSETAPSILMASMALLHAVYVIIHWAFRPENLFPRQFLDFMRNPLFYFFLRRRIEHEYRRLEHDRRRFGKESQAKPEKDSTR